MSVAHTVADGASCLRGKRDRTRPGPDVDDERQFHISDHIEPGIDEHLGLGPRHEDAGPDDEKQVPEPLRAGEGAGWGTPEHRRQRARPKTLDSSDVSSRRRAYRPTRSVSSTDISNASAVDAGLSTP